jgi:PEP-CTERM motif
MITRAQSGIAFSILTLGLVPAANADTISNISLASYYNASWSTEINGSQIVAAAASGNTGTGLSFSDYNGQYVFVGPDAPSSPHSTTIDLSSDSLLLNNNSTVNALMNLIYGEDGALDSIVEFTDSHGDSITVDMTGNNSIRDYNNNLSDDHSNGLSGSDPGVTAQMWWDNCASPTACSPSVNYQRLDAQTFVLPASWAGYDLTSMIITDPYTGGQQNDIALSALQLDVGPPTGSTPEPGSFVLLAAGLSGIGVFGRRTLRRD